MTDWPKGYDPNQMIGVPETGKRTEIWIGTVATPAEKAKHAEKLAAKDVRSGRAPLPSTLPPVIRPTSSAVAGRRPVDPEKLPPHLRGHPAFRR
jgi:hypothetical protein